MPPELLRMRAATALAPCPEQGHSIWKKNKNTTISISMATKTTGLHQRPTYNKLIQEIQHGEKIKMPNRDALFLRNSPYLAFLDGQGTTEMAEQQERVQKQVETEHVVREQSDMPAGYSLGVGFRGEARPKTTT